MNFLPIPLQLSFVQIPVILAWCGTRVKVAHAFFQNGRRSTPEGISLLKKNHVVVRASYPTSLRVPHAPWARLGPLEAMPTHFVVSYQQGLRQRCDGIPIAAITGRVIAPCAAARPDSKQLQLASLGSRLQPSKQISVRAMDMMCGRAGALAAVHLDELDLTLAHRPVRRRARLEQRSSSCARDHFKRQRAADPTAPMEGHRKTRSRRAESDGARIGPWTGAGAACSRADRCLRRRFVHVPSQPQM
jgi:hypothetical protein